MKVKVNYGECATIDENDMATLNDYEWIGDNIISFYFEYLQREMFQDCPEFLFLSPPTTQFIHLVSVEEGLTLDQFDFKSKKVIFFPVNNCNDPSVAEGGSHWSLMVYHTNFGSFHHYDSMGTSNVKPAQIIAKRFHQLITAKQNSKLVFVNEKASFQKNLYDCGAYAMYNAREIARTIKSRTEDDKYEAVKQIKEVGNEDLSNFRKDIKQIIMQFA